MGDIPATDPKPTPPKRRLAWGYLVMAAIVLGVFAVYVFAPELPRQLLGRNAPKPSGIGDEPTVAGNVAGGALNARDVDAELATLGRVNTISTPPAGSVKPPVDTGAPIVKEPTFAAETRASELLAEAESRYTAMDWDAAESAAAKISGLDAKPATKGRAMDIARGAPALKRLFRELDDRDELVRNWDTHPSLLRLMIAGRESLAVPLTTMEDPPTPVVDKPLLWVDKLRKSNRKGIFLLKGAKQFSKAEIDLTSVEPFEVDQAALRRDLAAQLDSKLTALKSNKAAQRDPMVFYEAGRFAYRNRLDDRVTELLDRALLLDPFLNRSVREANAGVLFGSLVIHAKNGNKQQAAAFMTAIDRRYKDTDQGRQARLFYDGKSAELLAAARQAEQAKKDEEEARLKARIEIQRKKGDEIAAKKIAEEAPVVEDEPAAPVAANAPPGLEGARQLYTEGATMVAAAMNMPASAARNDKYHAAAKVLTQAVKAFEACLKTKPGDAGIEEEMILCARAKFAAIKYAAAF